MIGDGQPTAVNRIAAGAGLIAASVGLGLIVQTGVFAGADAAVLRALAIGGGRGPDWLVTATRLLSTFGDLGARGLAVVGVLAALLTRARWRSGVIYLVTVTVSITGHTLAKLAFARTRPHLVPWLDDPHDLSFPSGHAAGTMVVLLLAALLFDRYRAWVAAIALSVAIGFTRPMLGVHWPTDVVGGWLWGAGFAMLGAGVARAMGLLDVDNSPSPSVII